VRLSVMILQWVQMIKKLVFVINNKDEVHFQNL